MTNPTATISTQLTVASHFSNSNALTKIYCVKDILCLFLVDCLGNIMVTALLSLRFVPINYNAFETLEYFKEKLKSYVDTMNRQSNFDH